MILKRSFTIISVLVITLAAACQQTTKEQEVQEEQNVPIEEGTITGEVYTSESIGWSMEVPTDWEILSKNDMQGYVDRGKDAVEEVAGELDLSGLQFLLSFQKNQFNMFQSTSEPFDELSNGDWNENNNAVNEMIYQAFANQGISCDTSTSTALVGGLEFRVLHVNVYSPTGDIIISQDMFSRHHNGYDFGATLSYNNEEDHATMLDAWKASKFSKD